MRKYNIVQVDGRNIPVSADFISYQDGNVLFCQKHDGGIEIVAIASQYLSVCKTGDQEENEGRKDIQ